MSSNSAEIVCSIDDLLTQILLRLPVKSLLRFKSVSKQWFSLIINPKFCHLHSSRKKNPPNGLFYSILGQHPYIPFSPQKPRNAPSVNLNFTNNPSVSTILQSCNGLFLCGNKRSRTFYVYNPTTNRSTLLPEFRRGFPCGKMLHAKSVKRGHAI
ncbi:hypothetical protein RD792_005182 [Penstemon davidsonii]|uniref:F-box domain-containing protein n=1 Tax=Penstemon davidsonii TaxID=160366 RepID=A0ABR0DKP0_9LAMI|nr:hypothetical protein RD792_005182 [Penstemon davidsonii]